MHTTSKYWLLISTALAAASPITSYALPTGGSVSSGSATITSTAGQTTINQTTQKAIVNWTGFNTSASERVQFNQPGASSITLNKISGSATRFDGQLNANGKVWLVNPQGMVFGKTAKVNVGGFLATASKISDSDFNAGNYTFTSGGSHLAAIKNEGSITVKDAGLATLVAPNVSNSGTIRAKLGKITMGGGDVFTLDTYGDNLVSFAVDPTNFSPLSANNTGTADATGGEVYMTVGDTTAAMDNIINLDGLVNAKTLTAVNHKGSINAGLEYLPGAGDNTVHLSASRNIWVDGTARVGNSTAKTNITLQSNNKARNNGWIRLEDGAKLTSGGGNITLGGGTNAAAGSAYGNKDLRDQWGSIISDDGIMLGESTISAGGGNIVLNGAGYDGTNDFSFVTPTGIYGYSANGRGTITTTGKGTISLNGKGGTGEWSPSFGITLTGYNLTTQIGALNLTGTGGLGMSSFGINGDNNRFSTATGALTLKGASGQSRSTYEGNYGLSMGNSVFTSGGAITLTGSSHPYTNGTGIYLYRSTVASTGTGARAAATQITGTGTGTGDGIYLEDSKVTTVDGNVTLTGTAKMASFPDYTYPIFYYPDTFSSSGKGKFYLVANTTP